MACSTYMTATFKTKHSSEGRPCDGPVEVVDDGCNTHLERCDQYRGFKPVTSAQSMAVKRTYNNFAMIYREPLEGNRDT